MMSDVPASPAGAPEVLSFETSVTLEDQLALQMRCLAAPTMRAGRLRRQVIVVLVAAACAPLLSVLAVLIVWATAPHASSPGPLLRALILEKPGSLVTGVLVMAVCTAGGALVQRWLTRPHMRRLLRRILQARPDVDPADPHLIYRAHVTVSNEGLESRTAIGATLVRWAVLKRWEETGGHIMVLGDAMVGFGLRTVAINPGSPDRFRAILASRLGPRANPTQKERAR